MKNRVRTLFLAGLACVTLGFASVSALVPEQSRDGVEIRQADYGERWPFKATRGWLRCEGAGAIVLNVQERDYAVNGLASARYAPIQAVWKSDQAADAGPIISRGLALCHW